MTGRATSNRVPLRCRIFGHEEMTVTVGNLFPVDYTRCRRCGRERHYWPAASLMYGREVVTWERVP